VRHYKIDSIDTQAYLNRAALVGCKNQALSESYAKQLYTRRYLRDASARIFPSCKNNRSGWFFKV
jgi:hypothetical protein